MQYTVFPETSTIFALKELTILTESKVISPNFISCNIQKQCHLTLLCTFPSLYPAGRAVKSEKYHLEPLILPIKDILVSLGLKQSLWNKYLVELKLRSLLGLFFPSASFLRWRLGSRVRWQKSSPRCASSGPCQALLWWFWPRGSRDPTVEPVQGNPLLIVPLRTLWPRVPRQGCKC